MVDLDDRRERSAVGRQSVPISRIAFAIADLMSEIKALMPRDAEPAPHLLLAPVAYVAVTSELAHHLGATLPPHRGPQIEVPAVKVGGLVIMRLSPEGEEMPSDQKKQNQDRHDGDDPRGWWHAEHDR